MVRGRKKAKQERLGREIKYGQSEVDFEALRNELERERRKAAQSNSTTGDDAGTPDGTVDGR